MERGTKRRREEEADLSVSDRATLRLLSKVPALNGARPGLRGRRGAVYVGDFSSDALVDALGESFASAAPCGDELDVDAEVLAPTEGAAGASRPAATADCALDTSVCVAVCSEVAATPAVRVRSEMPSGDACESSQKATSHEGAAATVPEPESAPQCEGHSSTYAPTPQQDSSAVGAPAPSAAPQPPLKAAEDDEI